MSEQMKDAILEQIRSMKEGGNVYERGRVQRIRDYILEVKGLESAAYFDEVRIPGKAIGYVTAILRNSVMVSIVKQYASVYVNDEVIATGKGFTALYSPDCLGHVVDMFGVDQMNARRFENVIELNVENRAVPIMDRRSVNRPLYTGILGIDLLYPIGRGQRQLIIGDKKTGKTQIGLDAITNQKGCGVLCIYISIGKTKKDVKDIYQQLARRGAMRHTIMLAASNDEAPPVLSLTPYVGLSIAEQYMYKGMDVLVVIDDLKRHADVYREISLLSGKEPGRDAYPSDIFYTHSRLLEKGCQHKDGGSITILPVVETRGADITDYISTNIISITDGQIVLSRKNFDRGQKPAIEYGLSVSRLGGAVQETAVKKLGSVVRRELLNYLETREIYELANVDDMGTALQRRLRRGQKLLAQFHQYKFQERDVAVSLPVFEELLEE